MKIISPIFDFSFKKKFFSDKSSDSINLPSISLDPLEMLDFRVNVASNDDIFWVKEICDVTSLSDLGRGTGISVRCASLLEIKIKKGEAVIAFAPDGRWAGFCFIISWNNAYVSNSGLIIAPEFRNTCLAKLIKRKIFELKCLKYPNAKVFSLTTGLALMKINQLGLEPATYSELTDDDCFWEDCKYCAKCRSILAIKKRKQRLCTARLYDL